MNAVGNEKNMRCRIYPNSTTGSLNIHRGLLRRIEVVLLVLVCKSTSAHISGEDSQSVYESF